MLQTIIDGAPPKARVVVVGVCMETDHIQPFFGVVKELEVRFAFGYTPAEFATTLDRLAAHQLPGIDGLVTDIVDLDGVARRLRHPGTPGDHGKILVRHAL